MARVLTRVALILAALFVAAVVVFFVVFNHPWIIYEDWQSDTRDAPLIGGRPGTSVRRWAEKTNPIDPAHGVKYWDRGWRGSNDETYSPREIAKRVARGLQRTTMHEEWRDSGSRIGRVIQRLAPLRFTLVSIEPIVVVMTPVELGEPGSREQRAALGPNWDEELILDGLMNRLAVGVRLPPSDDACWFSPDLHQEPTRLALASETTPIPGTSLTVTRTPDALTVSPLH